MADWYGVPFLRRLFCAERLSERAIAEGSVRVKMRCFRSSALLLLVTLADHLRFLVVFLRLFRGIFAVIGAFGFTQQGRYHSAGEAGV